MIGIQTVVSQVKNAIDLSLRGVANVIPSIIMICGLARRPGLSCLISTAKIVEQINAAGIPTSPAEDGSPNLTNQLVHSIVCEVFRALREDASIQVSIPPGAVQAGPFTNVAPNAVPIFGQMQ